jgi:hypothetical protein
MDLLRRDTPWHFIGRFIPGAGPRRDWLVSLAAGLIAAAYVWWYYAHAVPWAWSDFDQLWIGARALLDRRDPYVAVRANFPWPLYYPLPALVLSLPFAVLPQAGARVAFAAFSAGLTTWVVLRYRPIMWPMLCSVPFVYAIQRGQWVPLLVVAALTPSVVSGALLAVKPNVGLAIFAYRPSRQAILSAAVLAALSLVVLPSWPLAWLREVRNAPHITAPLVLPGGWVLLLAAARLREPGARLLAMTALLPQSRALIEVLPLALIPRSRRSALIQALAVNVLGLVITQHWSAAGLRTYPAGEYNPAHFNWSWPPILLLGYLPALWFVLLPLWSTHQRSGRLAWRVVLGILGALTLGLTWFVWYSRRLYAA